MKFWMLIDGYEVCVVRAESEEDARRVASAERGFDPAKSECEEIPVEGEEEVIVSYDTY